MRPGDNPGVGPSNDHKSVSRDLALRPDDDFRTVRGLCVHLGIYVAPAFQALVGERLGLGLRCGGIDNEWIDSFMLAHLAFVHHTEKDSKGNMLTRAGCFTRCGTLSWPWFRNGICARFPTNFGRRKRSI